jgi:hypothetical protein
MLSGELVTQKPRTVSPKLAPQWTQERLTRVPAWNVSMDNESEQLRNLNRQSKPPRLRLRASLWRDDWRAIDSGRTKVGSCGSE